MGRPAASSDSARNSSAELSAVVAVRTRSQYARSSRGSAASRDRALARTAAGVRRTTKCRDAPAHARDAWRNGSASDDALLVSTPIADSAVTIRAHAASASGTQIALMSIANRPLAYPALLSRQLPGK